VPRAFLTVLAAAVLSTGFASSVRAQERDLTDAVRAREVAFAQTLADRDFDAFRTFIAPDAIFFNGNEPTRGREDIVRSWAPLFEGPTAPFSWGPDVVEVLESGTLALTSGLVRDPAGAEIGRFNSIWRRDADGVWRIVFDKAS
jgi:ketosteroid isomerase-like protein